ncbi:DEAD/DEAH box helicase family protein [Dinoroseobacter sp. PD6]|uniref:DEAD/DEAH box helicase family protein n=1 Tax=Dinoroseobacter sp. PD6 TaxID=3028384 RepID=UPI00237B7020|nr:DEAD/DEAH box helicase family protein [Dinoroseobacter sp. PD6]MDD9715712.1 DEAD/DEAH box helicase family protein [Dinoroseobacter sp. PD6]
MLKPDISNDITGNLAPQIELRPYQRTALERWLFYIDKYDGRPKAPHLLFHMATGSGKTVLMAALDPGPVPARLPQLPVLRELGPDHREDQGKLPQPRIGQAPVRAHGAH